MKWAVRTRYLTSKYTSDGKWHTHTSKWFDDSDEAWNDKDRWELSLKDIIVESSSSLIHKGKIMEENLTPLEAVKDLLNNQYYIALCRIQGKKRCNNDIKIITNALEKYEKILNAIPEEIRSIDELQSMANWFYNHDYKKLKALKIIQQHKLLNYVLKNDKCAEMYHLSSEDIESLKGLLSL